MKYVNDQSKEVQEVVKPVIQRNAWQVKPGTMLCGLLASKHTDDRKKGLEVLTKLKNSSLINKPRNKILRGIRKLETPTLVWSAKHWRDIVEWDRIKTGVPAILSKISDEELLQAVSTPVVFSKLPLHSTSVERAVKLVSEASSKVYGTDKRHRHILGVLKSREMMPAFETKRDFVIKSAAT